VIEGQNWSAKEEEKLAGPGEGGGEKGCRYNELSSRTISRKRRKEEFYPGGLISFLRRRDRELKKGEPENTVQSDAKRGPTASPEW